MVDEEQISKEEVQTELPETSKVDEAKELLGKIEQANAESRAILERSEALAAEKILSGDSEAGTPAEEKKEESDEDYSKRILAGDV